MAGRMTQGAPRYAQLVRQRQDARASTPDAIADRERLANVLALVRRELSERWPAITPENASAVLEWQQARISELRRSHD